MFNGGILSSIQFIPEKLPLTQLAETLEGLYSFGDNPGELNFSLKLRALNVLTI
jgi:hypothetical protein